jgi:hypothetical protein
MTVKKKKQSPTSGAKGAKKLKLKKTTLKDLDSRGVEVKGGLMGSRGVRCDPGG